ncbi:hypothetical protein ACT4MK_33700 [Bradyrhizobium barranii]|uniref:hypothetical protein n=1 Tax=Bradyrhizobium TaxID=374 RepID=UPI003F28CA0A
MNDDRSIVLIRIPENNIKIVPSNESDKRAFDVFRPKDDAGRLRLGRLLDRLDHLVENDRARFRPLP